MFITSSLKKFSNFYITAISKTPLNSYCLGKSGMKINSMSPNKIDENHEKQNTNNQDNKTNSSEESIKSKTEEKKRKGKKKEKERDKMKEALKAEEASQNNIQLCSMDERKRPYNSMFEVKKPTEEEIEAYYLKRRRDDDPMNQYL